MTRVAEVMQGDDEDGPGFSDSDGGSDLDARGEADSDAYESDDGDGVRSCPQHTHTHSVPTSLCPLRV